MISEARDGTVVGGLALLWGGDQGDTYIVFWSIVPFSPLKALSCIVDESWFPWQRPIDTEASSGYTRAQQLLLSPLQSLNIPVPLTAQSMPHQSDSTAQVRFYRPSGLWSSIEKSLLASQLGSLTWQRSLSWEGASYPTSSRPSEIKVPSSEQWLDSGWLLLAPRQCHSWPGLICVPRKGSYEP